MTLRQSFSVLVSKGLVPNAGASHTRRVTARGTASDSPRSAATASLLLGGRPQAYQTRSLDQTSIDAGERRREGMT
jgi:hypothetical protein